MNHEEVGRYWNGNAETWTRLARAGYDVYRDYLNTPAFFAMLPDVTGLSGLDIGCGEGHNTRLLAQRGARITAIDIAENFIVFAQQAEADEPLGIEYRVASAVALPFPDMTFDFATGFMSFMDIPETERVVAEAYRVLAGGGRYAFTVWAKPDQAVGFGVVLRAIETHGTTNVGLPEGPPFFRFSEADACLSALAEAGFERPRVRQLPLIWRLPSADALFQAALCGAVRTSAALQAQTPEALVEIRRAVHDSLQQYADGATIALPMAVVLASASKP